MKKDDKKKNQVVENKEPFIDIKPLFVGLLGIVCIVLLTFQINPFDSLKILNNHNMENLSDSSYKLRKAIIENNLREQRKVSSDMEINYSLYQLLFELKKQYSFLDDKFDQFMVDNEISLTEFFIIYHMVNRQKIELRKKKKNSFLSLENITQVDYWKTKFHKEKTFSEKKESLKKKEGLLARFWEKGRYYHRKMKYEIEIWKLQYL